MLDVAGFRFLSVKLDVQAGRLSVSLGQVEVVGEEKETGRDNHIATVLSLPLAP